LACGFAGTAALDINVVYARLPTLDRMRMERLEPLDEFEEWQLINAHYCMSWGWKGIDDGAALLPQQLPAASAAPLAAPAPGVLPSALRPERLTRTV
jgi:hypothetical protein